MQYLIFEDRAVAIALKALRNVGIQNIAFSRPSARDFAKYSKRGAKPLMTVVFEFYDDKRFYKIVIKTPLFAPKENDPKFSEVDVDVIYAPETGWSKVIYRHKYLGDIIVYMTLPSARAKKSRRIVMQAAYIVVSQLLEDYFDIHISPPDIIYE